MTSLSLRPVLSRLLRIAVAAMTLLTADAALAQPPTAPPQDQIADELIGAGVFSAEGIQVGEVSAVRIGAGGEISELRMTMSSPLGLGQRIVVLPPGSFMLLRGAVVVDLSPEEVDALPSAANRRPGSKGA